MSPESLFCSATAVALAKEIEEKDILLFCVSAQVGALRNRIGGEVVAHQMKQVRERGQDFR